MVLLRSIIGLFGFMAICVSLINVWMTWMKGADTSFHWTIAFIGAVMLLQSAPPLIATYKEHLRNPRDD